ncbi:hypothetical protein BJF90_10410 [Pseudonocardia sp. CNS-004]|nr:hypothetical protein BJF90_10410 [Pseudonocardia sp. CNS-004]
MLAAHESGVRPQWRSSGSARTRCSAPRRSTPTRCCSATPLVEPQVDLRTWVAHPVLTRSVVRALAGAIVATAVG